MFTRTSQLSKASEAVASQDAIIISRLRVNSHIGVPDEERAQQQMLVVTLHLVPSKGFSELADEVGNTVDYAAVCEFVKNIAQEKPRKLIETLGEDICASIFQNFQVSEVTLELEKRILWDTDWVGLSMKRFREA